METTAPGARLAPPLDPRRWWALALLCGAGAHEAKLAEVAAEAVAIGVTLELNEETRRRPSHE